MQPLVACQPKYIMINLYFKSHGAVEDAKPPCFVFMSIECIYIGTNCINEIKHLFSLYCLHCGSHEYRTSHPSSGDVRPRSLVLIIVFCVFFFQPNYYGEGTLQSKSICKSCIWMFLQRKHFFFTFVIIIVISKSHRQIKTINEFILLIGVVTTWLWSQSQIYRTALR